MAAFLEALRSRGLREGRDFTFDMQAITPLPGGVTSAAIDDLREIARRQIAAGASIIVADQSTTALAAMEVTGSVPVVFWSGDPVAEGLVQTLAHPGKNATGMTFRHDQPLLVVQLLRAIKPQIKRLGVMFNPTYAPGHALVEKMTTAATSLGIEVKTVQVDAPTDFDRAFDTFQQWNADAVVATNHGMFRRNALQLAAAALHHHVPLISPYTELAEAGALLSWIPDFKLWSQRAADYVLKILSGTRAGDLPVEESVPWQFAVNLETARRLGITIPEQLRRRAIQVIDSR